jgi:hypothetical protein
MDIVQQLIQKVAYFVEVDGQKTMVVPGPETLMEAIDASFTSLFEEGIDPTDEAVVERAVSLIEKARKIAPQNNKTMVRIEGRKNDEIVDDLVRQESEIRRQRRKAARQARKRGRKRP